MALRLIMFSWHRWKAIALNIIFSPALRTAVTRTCPALHTRLTKAKHLSIGALLLARGVSLLACPGSEVSLTRRVDGSCDCSRNIMKVAFLDDTLSYLQVHGVKAASEAHPTPLYLCRSPPEGSRNFQTVIESGMTSVMPRNTLKRDPICHPPLKLFIG